MNQHYSPEAFRPAALEATRTRDVGFPEQHFKRVFTSDMHIGRNDFEAPAAVNFADMVRAKEWYLVGDTFDLWRYGIDCTKKLGRLFRDQILHLPLGREGDHDLLRRSTDPAPQHENLEYLLNVPPSHIDMGQKFLRQARNGTHLRFIAGNHDDLARKFLSREYHITDNISVVPNRIFIDLGPVRAMVIHSDQYDPVISKFRRASVLATRAFHGMKPYLGRLGNKADELHMRYVENEKPEDMARLAIADVKKLNETIAQENAANPGKEAVKPIGVVITGHTHKAAMIEQDGILYLNLGCWLKGAEPFNHNVTLAERLDGQWQFMQMDLDHPAGLVPHPMTPEPFDILAHLKEPETPARPAAVASVYASPVAAAAV